MGYDSDSAEAEWIDLRVDGTVSRFAVGDEVRVVDGPFRKGWVGTVDKVTRQHRGARKHVYWVRFGNENHAFFEEKLEAAEHQSVEQEKKA